MRIAYIDAKVNNPPEDYSIRTRRYGGGGVFARYAKELLNGGSVGNETFDVFASQECFENLTLDDRITACKPVPDNLLMELRRGMPLRLVIENADTYDLFLHHHDNMTFNMTGLEGKPLVHWALMGDGMANHPNTPYSLVYRKDRKAVFGKTFYVQLGKPIPDTFHSSEDGFKEPSGEDYLFQCTRHDQDMNTIEVVKWCNETKHIGYFAGPTPPAGGYPIIDEIDGRYTHWLGSISEQEKLRLLKGARLSTLLLKWDCPFNQSAIESLSQGCPLVVNPRGFLTEVVRDGFNGFHIGGLMKDLSSAWEAAPWISREECWNSSKKYNEIDMVKSFKKAFEDIMKDWKGNSSIKKDVEKTANTNEGKTIQIEPAKVVFEVGVGQFNVCRTMRLIESGVKVVMFEPNPHNYEQLKKIIGNRKNVEIHNVALSDFEGEAELVLEGDSSYVNGVMSPSACSKSADARSKEKRVIVPVKTIDKYDRGDIDLLLIDVEGSEFNVISRMISRPRMISIETEMPQCNYKNPNLDKIKKWMSDNGYVFLKQDDADSWYLRVNESAAAQGQKETAV
jgi:FkbM family methyltransferase